MKQEEIVIDMQKLDARDLLNLSDFSRALSQFNIT